MIRVRTAFVLCAAVLAGCGGYDDPTETGATDRSPVIGDPGLVHVHGLGENPVDGALFVATHTGLFRIESAGAKPDRIAGRYQDTMGFTVVGPDRFLGSGHPDGRDGLPPFLGLIESEDAGQTWTAKSLQGQADFHVLEARGGHVYGYGSDWETREPRFLVSTDGGERWTRRTEPEPLNSLAIDPRDARRVIASGEEGLHRSRDGGGRWRGVRGGPGLLTWPAKDRLYLLDAQGKAHSSDDGGDSWSTAGSAGGEPAAFEATGPRELYVALHDGSIKRSGDGGRSWKVFYRGA